VGLGIVALSCFSAAGTEPPSSLESPKFQLRWERWDDGWHLTQASLRNDSGLLALGDPSGEYTLLYSASAPSFQPVPYASERYPNGFPEPQYKWVTNLWTEARSPAALNTAGEALQFYPETVRATPEGHLVFSRRLDLGVLTADWSCDPLFPTDVRVREVFTARVAGYYSLATPTIASVRRDDLGWAMVPGCFAGARIEPDLVVALGYGHGLPDRPVLARERTASTLMAVATTREGATLAAIAEPGMAEDPWAQSSDSRKVWQLGLSHMNRRGALAGTLYHPVLGEAGSQLQAGQSVATEVRYSVRADGWKGAMEHAAYDVYQLRAFLALKQPRQSLSERLTAMRRYVTNSRLSLWKEHAYQGRTIGAQAYLGGVYGSDGSVDGAMKNSDYGAMWMLAQMTGDPVLQHDRLPAARAFKLAQQDTTPGFFSGSAAGQYYLPKLSRFAEEYGDYVEPVAITYYICCDIGNILLFQPKDAELRDRLRQGADRLLAWQKPDGHWEVAYDPRTKQARFPDLDDYRPTFYGLLVAYRMLGDVKYLNAACRGADWLYENGIVRGQFLGVCGDSRFLPDFATAQIAEAMLELHEITGSPQYREAGLMAAQAYLSSIYTHPLATRQEKSVRGVARQDWEINQSGLSYEHGGTLGSANLFGPILLASHAGLFVRVSRLTGQPIYRDLARAAALGRDAFVDPSTSVASYYWNRMNAGPGPFPHHAWWQIGWIMDYLLSEAELRSQGQITFPHGFFAPKVGPHRAYGFAPGQIFGAAARLSWNEWSSDNPAVDAIAADGTDGSHRYVILLNETAAPVSARISLPGAPAFAAVSSRDASNAPHQLTPTAPWAVTLPPFGLALLNAETVAHP